jgi:dTDP-4-amino-4,6-dideoxygalactose transaminase
VVKTFDVNLLFMCKKNQSIAHALSLTENFAGNDKIVVFLGDNIFEYSIKPYVKNFENQKEGARVLLKKVNDPDSYWKRRQEIWNRYNEAFKDLPLFTPAPIEPDTKHAYHLYTLLLDIDNLKMTRDKFLDEMTKRNIGVGVHYISLHLHPYYQKNFGYMWGDFQNAGWISDRTISLPISAKLTDEDVEDVIEAVVKITKYHS